MAAIYYRNRGFEKTPDNSLKHLPDYFQRCYQEMKDPESERYDDHEYVHFVTDADLIRHTKQQNKDPNDEDVRKEFMHLFHLKGLLKFRRVSTDVPAEGTALTCVPPPNTDFLKFPLSDTAKRVNEAVKNLALFNHPCFNVQSKDDEIRELEDDEILELHYPSHPKKFSKVLVSGDTYAELKKDITDKTYNRWLKDEEIEFFSLWLMKDENAPVAKACEIVSPLVTNAVESLYGHVMKNAVFESQEESWTHPISMKNIHEYLSTHGDLLSKKFILFVQNDGDQHWWGWAAINPWVELARVLFERQKAEDEKVDSEFGYHTSFVSGILPCDGINPDRSYNDAIYIIWFLNMASVYRDMAHEGIMDEFDYRNHTPATYWMLGVRGPFGICDMLTAEETITYKLLRLNDNIRPKQRDGCNCGVIWCLFVYDMLLQSFVPYDFELTNYNELPLKIGIGKTWLPPNIYKNILAGYAVDFKKEEKMMTKHCQAMYKIFREELVVCLEKMRGLKLSNFGNVVEPEGWGVPSNEYTQVLTTNMKKQLAAFPNKKEYVKNLSTESKCRQLSKSYDNIIPGSMFLRPSIEIFEDSILNDLYPHLHKDFSLLKQSKDNGLPFTKDDITYLILNYKPPVWTMPENKDVIDLSKSQSQVVLQPALVNTADVMNLERKDEKEGSKDEEEQDTSTEPNAETQKTSNVTTITWATQPAEKPGTIVTPAHDPTQPADDAEANKARKLTAAETSVF